MASEFKKNIGSSFLANTETDSVTTASRTYDLLSNLLKNGAAGSAAIQSFSNDAGSGTDLVFARGRGTDDVPLPVSNGDSVGRLVFSASDANGALREDGAFFQVQSNEPTATAAPMNMFFGVQDIDNGTSIAYILPANGNGSVTATGTYSINSAGLLLNNEDPFDPIFLCVGYTSPVGVGTPSFTTPLTIAYGVKPEGTWTKITGMSSINSNGDIDFSGDTITINVAGDYTVSLSSTNEVDVNQERLSLYSIEINGDDTDKALASLVPNASASESNSSQWNNVASSVILSLNTTDTVRVFYAQLNEGGSLVNDVNIGIINLCVKKIGMNG